MVKYLLQFLFFFLPELLVVRRIGIELGLLILAKIGYMVTSSATVDTVITYYNEHSLILEHLSSVPFDSINLTLLFEVESELQR